MNIWSEIILPIVPVLGMLLFFNPIIGIIKIRVYGSSYLSFIYYVCSNSMLGYGNTFK